MDCRQLNLDCEELEAILVGGGWRVFCRNTGMVLSYNQPSAEHAWAEAAERLAEVLSDIRRSASSIER